MRWNIGWFALFGAAVAVGAGCGGQTGGSHGNVSATDFPRELAKAICDNADGCCTKAGKRPDRAACEDTLGQSFKGALFRDGSTNTFDSSKSGACLDQIAAITERCGPFDNVFGRDVCANVFSTQSSDNHGMSGSPCDGTCYSNGVTSVCESSSSIGDGGAAASPLTCYVSDGLYCATDSDSRCHEQASPSTACQLDIACRNGYCESGSCVALPAGPAAEGEHCISGLNVCSDGLYCDGDVSACAKLKAAGTPCSRNAECVTSTCTQGACSGTDNSQFIQEVCGG